MRTIIAWILALVAFVLLIRYTNILTDNDFVKRRPGTGDVMTGFVGCISPRGDRILSGQTVTAYANPRVTSLSDCQSQSRSCSIIKQKGILSGSYQHESCRLYVPPAPVGRSCTTPRGATVPGGIAIIAYQSTVGLGGVCQAERRLCADGVLQGSYRYPDCNLRLTGPDITRSGYTVNNPVFSEPFVGAPRYPAELVQPKKIETSNLIFNTDGKRVSRLTQPPNERNNNINNPVTTDRSYLNPIISPSVAPERWRSLYPNNIQSGCVAPRGERIVPGGLVQAFVEPYGTRDNICRSEFRVCTQGRLGGSYSFASCLQSDLYTDQLREQIRTDEQADVFYNPTCTTPRRREISDGEQTIAYENRLVASPAQCQSQTRSCSRGVLDGSYRYSQCLVVPATYSGLSQPGGFNPSEVVFPEIEPFAAQYLPPDNQSTAFRRRLDANIQGTKNFPRDVRERIGERSIDLYELVN